MAKTNSEKITGSQACEYFGLKRDYKNWMTKKSLLMVEKTLLEWEKFFKENKVI